MKLFDVGVVRTKNESLKSYVREHKFIKVGPMSLNIALGKPKGTAVDVELMEGESVKVFLNNGKMLELKVRFHILESLSI